MEWFLLVIGTILVVECFLRTPLLDSVKALQGLLGKIMATLKSSAISDHWKEKVLPVYAGRLFSLSIKLFMLVLIALLPMIAIAVLADWRGIPLISLLSSWIGMVASTGFAVIYIIIRNRVIPG
jgi:hypothetical protein